MDRFSKVYIPGINPLTLISGYQNEPLVSLEEALKPFDGKIDQLSKYIKEAKTECNRSSKHHLTHDESAAIYIYTMKWKPRCLYDHLQAAWNSEDRSQLKPWFKYLKLFKSALDKLPDVKTEIWQGKAYDEDTKEKLSSKKKVPLYSSMGFCSTSDNEIKDYLYNNVDTKMILIGYESVNGKSVSGYTAGSLNEVILWPGTKLGVAQCVVIDAKGSMYFHLKGQTGK
jgi:hypothetical protein